MLTPLKKTGGAFRGKREESAALLTPLDLILRAA
jgi:hypothetical protein